MVGAWVRDEMAANGHTCSLLCSASVAICWSKSETRGLISSLWLEIGTKICVFSTNAEWEQKQKPCWKNQLAVSTLIVVNCPCISGFFLMVCSGHQDLPGMKAVSVWVGCEQEKGELHVFILFPNLIIYYIFDWLNTYPIHQWTMRQFPMRLLHAILWTMNKI